MSKKYALGNKGLEIRGDITLEEFAEACEMISNMMDIAKFKLPYWLGDLVNAGDRLFPDKYEQFLDVKGMGPSSLKNLAWMCRRTTPETRHDRFTLCFTYCGLPAEKQLEMKKRIEDEDLTFKEAKQMVAGNPDYKNGKKIEAKQTSREKAMNAFDAVFDSAEEFRRCNTARDIARTSWEKCVNLLCQ